MIASYDGIDFATIEATIKGRSKADLDSIKRALLEMFLKPELDWRKIKLRDEP